MPNKPNELGKVDKVERRSSVGGAGNGDLESRAAELDERHRAEEGGNAQGDSGEPVSNGPPPQVSSSPKSETTDMVGEAIMRKFEEMFIRHQLEMNRSTTEAVKEVAQSFRQDINGLSNRLASLEGERRGARGGK